MSNTYQVQVQVTICTTYTGFVLVEAVNEVEAEFLANDAIASEADLRDRSKQYAHTEDFKVLRMGRIG